MNEDLFTLKGEIQMLKAENKKLMDQVILLEKEKCRQEGQFKNLSSQLDKKRSEENKYNAICSQLEFTQMEKLKVQNECLHLKRMKKTRTECSLPEEPPGVFDYCVLDVGEISSLINCYNAYRTQFTLIQDSLVSEEHRDLAFHLTQSCFFSVNASRDLRHKYTDGGLCCCTKLAMLSFLPLLCIMLFDSLHLSLVQDKNGLLLMQNAVHKCTNFLSLLMHTLLPRSSLTQTSCEDLCEYALNICSEYLQLDRAMQTHFHYSTPHISSFKNASSIFFESSSSSAYSLPQLISEGVQPSSHSSTTSPKFLSFKIYSLIFDYTILKESPKQQLNFHHLLDLSHPFALSLITNYATLTGFGCNFNTENKDNQSCSIFLMINSFLDFFTSKRSLSENLLVSLCKLIASNSPSKMCGSDCVCVCHTKVIIPAYTVSGNT